ncbi:hypothetical protein BKA93DRAFT_105710 [Sparassis latifolia]
MGWEMYLGFDRDMGLSLWDIHFRDERIIYELAPQEAIAHYAGNDPMQSSTAWLDRFFGMVRSHQSSTCVVVLVVVHFQPPRLRLEMVRRK